LPGAVGAGQGVIDDHQGPEREYTSAKVLCGPPDDHPVRYDHQGSQPVITHIGRAKVLPHPDRANPKLAPMVRDDEIERVAVAEAIRYEEARGCVMESVESANRGCDLISRRARSEDPKTFVEVRFIEVKGRAGVGVIALSENEYRTAQRLKGGYWLYTVFNCASQPQLHAVQDTARLGWKPVLAVEHYQLEAAAIRQATGERGV
jgi:hypothetical protein